MAAISIRKTSACYSLTTSLPVWHRPPATKQPDGQIFASAVGQITFTTHAILSPRKGRWPSSRTLGWDAVDGGASCARWDGRAGFTVHAKSPCGKTTTRRVIFGYSGVAVLPV